MKYVIRNKLYHHAYWSNIGWVDFDSILEICQFETNTIKLPINGEWVLLEEITL